MEATFSTEIEATQKVVMRTQRNPGGLVVAHRNLNKSGGWENWTLNPNGTMSLKNLKTLISSIERAEQIHINLNPPQETSS